MLGNCYEVQEHTEGVSFYQDTSIISLIINNIVSKSPRGCSNATTSIAITLWTDNSLKCIWVSGDVGMCEETYHWETNSTLQNISH